MDWAAFLDANAIPYVTSGKNTRRGEISIQCPWCHTDDPSQHLGIGEKAWGCLRNSAHRGYSTPKLVAALLQCSFEQASLVTRQYSHPDPDDFDKFKAEPSVPLRNIAKQGKAGLAFRPILPIGLTLRFWNYLLARGFPDPAALCAKYALQCCLTDRWKDRIIIPVGQHDWTGRALQNPVKAPRYLSSSVAIKKTVYLEDDLQRGETLLFITEGPFDALKLDFYGEPLGGRATCTFGTSVTSEQIAILNCLAKHYARVVVLFDAEAIEPAFALSEWILHPSVVIGELPVGIKDPGEMTAKQVKELISRYTF